MTYTQHNYLEQKTNVNSRTTTFLKGYTYLKMDMNPTETCFTAASLKLNRVKTIYVHSNNRLRAIVCIKLHGVFCFADQRFLWMRWNYLVRALFFLSFSLSTCLSSPAR
jgi:hypothetical protein